MGDDDYDYGGGAGGEVKMADEDELPVHAATPQTSAVPDAKVDPVSAAKSSAAPAEKLTLPAEDDAEDDYDYDYEAPHPTILDNTDELHTEHAQRADAQSGPVSRAAAQDGISGTAISVKKGKSASAAAPANFDDFDDQLVALKAGKEQRDGPAASATSRADSPSPASIFTSPKNPRSRACAEGPASTSAPAKRKHAETQQQPQPAAPPADDPLVASGRTPIPTTAGPTASSASALPKPQMTPAVSDARTDTPATAPATARTSAPSSAAPGTGTVASASTARRKVGTGRLFENVVFAVVLPDLQEELMVKQAIEALGGVIAPPDTARRVQRGAPPFVHPVLSRMAKDSKSRPALAPEQLPSSPLGYAYLCGLMQHPSVSSTGVHVVITRGLSPQAREWAALAPPEAGGGWCDADDDSRSALSRNKSLSRSGMGSADASADGDAMLGTDYYGDGHSHIARAMHAHKLLPAAALQVSQADMQAQLFGGAKASAPTAAAQSLGPDVDRPRAIVAQDGAVLSPDGVYLDYHAGALPVSPWMRHELSTALTPELAALYTAVMRAAEEYFRLNLGYYRATFAAHGIEYVSLADVHNARSPAAPTDACFAAYLLDSTYTPYPLMLVRPSWLLICKQYGRVLDPRRLCASQVYVDLRNVYIRTLIDVLANPAAHAAILARPAAEDAAACVLSPSQRASSKEERAAVIRHIRLSGLLPAAPRGLGSVPRLLLLSSCLHRSVDLDLARRSHRYFAPIVAEYNRFLAASGSPEPTLAPVPAFLLHAAELKKAAPSSSSRLVQAATTFSRAKAAMGKAFFLAYAPGTVPPAFYAGLQPGVYVRTRGCVGALVLDPPGHGSAPVDFDDVFDEPVVKRRKVTQTASPLDEYPTLVARRTRPHCLPGTTLADIAPSLAPAVSRSRGDLTRSAPPPQHTDLSQPDWPCLPEAALKANTLLAMSPEGASAQASSLPTVPRCILFYLPVPSMPWLRVPFAAPKQGAGAGLKVCLSGFSPSEKARMVDVIALASSSRGNAVVETLDATCTHLVSSSAKTAKTTAARKLGVPVVNVHWVTESVRAGAPLDEGFFPVQ
jgi:hypothetical protein